MKQTTRNYVGQNKEMYGNSRLGTRGSGDVPRSTSPLPMRSTSPRPGYSGQQHARSASPNPYGGGRPRQTPSTSPARPPYTNGSTSRYHSPNDIRRSASPQPQYAQQQRPNSSGGVQLQLAPGDSNRGIVSQRAGGQSNARPLTYYGGQQAHPSNDTGARNRSKSAANGRQYTKDGRPILEFGKEPLACFRTPTADVSHSTCIIPIQCCNPRRVELCKRRHPRCSKHARRWMVGGRSYGQKRSARAGPKQLLADLLSDLSA